MNLSELIRHVMTTQDMTQAALTERAKAAGYSLPRAALSGLVRHDLREFPKPDTIMTLAAALAVTPEVVVSAVCNGFGLSVVPAHSPDGMVVVSPVGELTAKQVDEAREQLTRALDGLGGPRVPRPKPGPKPGQKPRARRARDPHGE